MDNADGENPVELSQTEARLQDNVRLAKERYECAKNEAHRLLNVAQDVGVAETDGVAAISRACELQRVATREYTEALRALSNFVLDRKFLR